jgi:hypothetical protein
MKPKTTKILITYIYNCKKAFDSIIVEYDVISPCIVLGYMLDDRGFQSQHGVGNFLFTPASRPALGPI